MGKIKVIIVRNLNFMNSVINLITLKCD